jgi:hypothetical protein
VRDLQLYLNPQAGHLLDWFHLAMRLTVMQQTAKGLPDTIQAAEGTCMLRDPMVRSLERLQWSLWRGNLYKAFHKIAARAPRCGGGTRICSERRRPWRKSLWRLDPRFLMLSVRVSHRFRLGVDSMGRYVYKKSVGRYTPRTPRRCACGGR